MSVSKKAKKAMIASGEWFKEHHEFQPLPDYGDLMTLQDFVNAVKEGVFIDYDGYGHYSDGKQMSNKMVKPSDLNKARIDWDWSHIVWFNQ